LGVLADEQAVRLYAASPRLGCGLFASIPHAAPTGLTVCSIKTNYYYARRGNRADIGTW